MGLELAVCAFAIVLALRTKDEEILALVVLSALGLGSFAAFITGMIISVKIHELITNRVNTIQFMKEIATKRPGIDTAEWDIIAARMNPVLYSSSSLATPYFFYDGESCYSFLKIPISFHI